MKIILLADILITFLGWSNARYTPDWPSLDTRPLPQWYDDAKIGIFLHWGVFSVPSFEQGPWFWYHWQREKAHDYVNFMKKNYPPNFTYGDFASQFTCEFYDPSAWADIFKASGAKYVVLVTKHHEGFCNWATKVSFNWNSVDVGPKRDLTGDLASAVRNRTDLRFGVYHSLFEFFNPKFIVDSRNKFKTQDFVRDKTMPELHELVENYKPEVIWSDGIGGGPDTYWNSTHFLAWLYNDSPVKDTVVVNDRWGTDTKCKHGDFWNCKDKYNPKVLQKHKWENAMSIGTKSWGYTRTSPLADYIDIYNLTELLAETISCGGNLLINVGPTHDGRIMPIYEERLRQLGSWLDVNGEAVYKSKPWTYQNDTTTPRVWYTKRIIPSGYDVYAFALDWPKGNILTLGAPQPDSRKTKVSMLGYPHQLEWSTRSKGISIRIPYISPSEMPCQWAWVFKLSYLKN